MKFIISVFLLVYVCSSCKTPKNITYFMDVSDTINVLSIDDTGYKPLIVKPDDILHINITSPNAEANSFFLTQGPTFVSGASTATTATATQNTYLVDKEGGIEMPLIGRIMVKGMTTSEIKEVLRKKNSSFSERAGCNGKAAKFQNYSSGGS
jgi:polysaccharide export outer membrane protein